MKYNVIGYFLSEGFRNVFKNKKSTFSCLGVMCATMLMFGLFFVIGQNINNAIKDLEKEQGMQVFMYPEATDEQIAKLKEDLGKIEGINTIEFVSKEEGYNTMKKRLGDNAKALDGFTPDFFEVSYIITLTDLSLNNQVYEAISKLDNVKEIQNKSSTIETLSSVGKAIRVVTFTIFAILILISLFIISNTIKLTVHARRKEISIMKYVGATNGFIRWPFMVEGMLIGLISVLISLLILAFSYNAVITQIEQSLINNRLNIPLLTFPELFQTLLIVYLVLGIGIGALGSAISMKKYLEV